MANGVQPHPHHDWGKFNLNTFAILISFLTTFAGIIAVWTGVQYRLSTAEERSLEAVKEVRDLNITINRLLVDVAVLNATTGRIETKLLESNNERQR